MIQWLLERYAGADSDRSRLGPRQAGDRVHPSEGDESTASGPVPNLAPLPSLPSRTPTCPLETRGYRLSPHGFAQHRTSRPLCAWKPWLAVTNQPDRARGGSSTAGGGSRGWRGSPARPPMEGSYVTRDCAGHGALLAMRGVAALHYVRDRSASGNYRGGSIHETQRVPGDPRRSSG